jgi:hypothetical protein
LVPNRKISVLRRVNFYDERNRPLFLIGRIVFKIGSRGTATPAGSRHSCVDESRVYPIVLGLEMGRKTDMYVIFVLDIEEATAKHAAVELRSKRKALLQRAQFVFASERRAEARRRGVLWTGSEKA